MSRSSGGLTTKTMAIAGRCPTCGQRVEEASPAPGPDSTTPARWRVQYWRNPVPKRDAVMELGVFTPEGDLLYAAPLTERNDQLAQAIVVAMNGGAPTG